MTDVRIVLAPDGLSADWSWNDGGDDLLIGNDLENAILVSLFSDARNVDPRYPREGGWWADAHRERPIGSLVWTLRRAKRNTETLRRAEDYCRTALAWLVADGVARTVDVRAWWLNGSDLVIRIVVTEADGTARNLQFAWVWDTL